MNETSSYQEIRLQTKCTVFTFFNNLSSCDFVVIIPTEYCEMEQWLEVIAECQVYFSKALLEFSTQQRTLDPLRTFEEARNMLRRLKSNLNLSIVFLNFSRIVKFVKKTREVEYEYAILEKVFEGENYSF